MKRDYELTFIVRIESNEDAINETIEQVRAWVEADEGGTVTKIDRWGRRKLAYEIDRQREGYYVLFHAALEPATLDELERNLRLAPAIMRYLIVRAGE